jgi:DNA-directed RNA polymerase specialized sigma24 family protein
MNAEKLQLLTLQDFKKLHSKTLRKFFLSQQDVEEIHQEYCFSCFQYGYERRCEHIISDYLRKRSGRKGTGSYTPLQNFVELKDSNLMAGTSEHGNTGQRSFGHDVGSREFHFRDRIRNFNKIDRSIMILTYEWGLNEIEIADLFGVSESRVSQWHARIQKRLSARIAKEARTEAERKSKVETVLREEAEGDQREVEQETIEGLERCQSFAMASFDEASF